MMKGEVNMNFDRQAIVEDLIRSMMFFGIVSNWTPDKLVQELVRLGIEEAEIHRVLSQGLDSE